MAKPPNKGHVGDNINSIGLSFVEVVLSYIIGRCKDYRESNILKPKAVSLVENCYTLSLYISEGPLSGFTPNRKQNSIF